MPANKIVLFERELPQKQYHQAAYNPISIPKDCKPEMGDSYIDYWATYKIDRIVFEKGSLTMYCTKTKHSKMVKNTRYVKERVQRDERN